MSADLLIFNAVLCAVLDIFIIQVSMRFCLSHKKVNDVMQSTTEKVKQLLEEKANFIANATHELRTPMMQILGLVELLNTVNKDRDTEPLIETLRTATMSVIALVNDVLDYEKLGKGMIRLEQTSFDIRELIKRLLMMSAIHAHAKKIELMAVTCMRVPQFVIGDQMRLYQILQNLLNNAIKFTVPREETNEIIIKVDSCLVPNDSSRLQLDISVRDTGIGLSRDSIPYLFQAFRQASSSTSRLYGGTGLGLVISKNLAQVMNGDICVNSDGPGKGTVFNVAVQVGWQGAALDASMRLPIRTFEFGWTVRPASGTAVIFDDVPTALSLLEKATEELGFEVRSFNTFQSMTQFLLTKNPIPKLILVDIGTIGSTSESASGFASLEYIRKLDPVYENLHVIALKDQDDVLTVSTPYTCFYSKPIISEQIQATILSIISAEHKYSNGVSAKYEDSTNLHKGKRCRVLLVDDNTVNLKIIGRMIEQLGHEATLCSSSSSAFEILARNQSETHIAGQVEDAGNENPIDVIVTDFMMPEVNGIQLIQKIRRLERERPGCRVIPIILTSGNPKSTFEKDLESYAPASFMMKPFTIKELKESLENYCDRESNVTRTMHPP